MSDRNEPDATVARIRASFEKAIHTRRSLLPRVRGNFLMHIPGVATWTVVTSGARTGIYDEATRDVIAFFLWAEIDVVLEMFSSSGADLSRHLESGRLRVRGDAGVFRRFAALVAPVRNTCSIRLASF